MKNKKANENFGIDSVFFYIITGVAIGFVAIFFVISMSKYSSTQATIPSGIEKDFLIERFLKSEKCFVSSKFFGARNIIDVSKFTQESIDNCYPYSKEKIPAFQLQLISGDLMFDKRIKTFNWNDNRDISERKPPRTLFVDSNSKTSNGVMIIEIQNP